MKITNIIFAKRKSLPLKISYTQGTNAIPLEFVFADYTIPEGSEARIYVKKPSGKEIYNAAVIDGNTVTAEVTTQMSAEAGRCPAQLQIVKSGQILNSYVFMIDVEKSIVDDSAIESKDEFTILDQLIDQARQTLSDVSDTIQRADTAIKNANDAAGNANTAAGKANSSASAADTAAGRANSSASAADTAAGGANTAASKANSAAKLIEGLTVSAQKVDPGGAASAKVSTVGDHLNIDFGIPEGLPGDPAELASAVIDFESGDEETPEDYVDIPVAKNTDTISTLFNKFTTAIRNARLVIPAVKNLIKLMGSSDISKLADGTVTGALLDLNSDIKNTEAFKLENTSYVSGTIYQNCYYNKATGRVDINVIVGISGAPSSNPIVYIPEKYKPAGDIYLAGALQFTQIRPGELPIILTVYSVNNGGIKQLSTGSELTGCYISGSYYI